MKAILFIICFLFTVSPFARADGKKTVSWQDYILDREIIELLEYHQFTIEDLYFFKNENYIIHASLSPDKEMIAFVVHIEDSAKLFITKLMEKSVKAVREYGLAIQKLLVKKIQEKKDLETTIERLRKLHLKS